MLLGRYRSPPNLLAPSSELCEQGVRVARVSRVVRTLHVYMVKIIHNHKLR